MSSINVNGTTVTTINANGTDVKQVMRVTNDYPNGYSFWAKPVVVRLTINNSYAVTSPVITVTCTQTPIYDRVSGITVSDGATSYTVNTSLGTATPASSSNNTTNFNCYYGEVIKLTYSDYTSGSYKYSYGVSSGTTHTVTESSAGYYDITVTVTRTTVSCNAACSTSASSSCKTAICSRSIGEGSV